MELPFREVGKPAGRAGWHPGFADLRWLKPHFMPQLSPLSPHQSPERLVKTQSPGFNPPRPGFLFSRLGGCGLRMWIAHQFPGVLLIPDLILRPTRWLEPRKWKLRGVKSPPDTTWLEGDQSPNQQFNQDLLGSQLASGP